MERIEPFMEKNNEGSREEMKKIQTPGSLADQIEASKYLEIEAQKRGARMQEDQDRVRRLQTEIKSEFPKIELDLSKDKGPTGKGRRGEVLAAEHAWSTEKTKVRTPTRPTIPPPTPKKSFFGRLFS